MSRFGLYTSRSRRGVSPSCHPRWNVDIRKGEIRAENVSVNRRGL
jgi:hypothetical protein